MSAEQPHPAYVLTIDCPDRPGIVHAVSALLVERGGNIVESQQFSDLDEDVRQSIARIKASPFIPRKDQVRGFVYDVHDGRLREVT